MRLYMRGGKPRPDRLAQIAIANHVYIDWLATGREPKASSDNIEQVFDAYTIESTLSAVIETVEEVIGDRKLSAKKKAALISVCSKIYLAMRPEERSTGFGKIATTIIQMLMADEI